MVDWRKVSCEKNIAGVAHSSSDLEEVDKSEDELGEMDDWEINMTATQALESLDGVKSVSWNPRRQSSEYDDKWSNRKSREYENEKPKASRHQRFSMQKSVQIRTKNNSVFGHFSSSVILYYCHLYCLLVYLKKFHIFTYGAFFVKQIILRELIFAGTNFCKDSDFKYFTGFKFNQFRKFRVSE